MTQVIFETKMILYIVKNSLVSKSRSSMVEPPDNVSSVAGSNPYSWFKKFFRNRSAEFTLDDVLKFTLLQKSKFYKGKNAHTISGGENYTHTDTQEAS